MDTAERARLHAVAITDTRRAITERASQHGRTDCLERHLARLESAHNRTMTVCDEHGANLHTITIR